MANREGVGTFAEIPSVPEYQLELVLAIAPHRDEMLITPGLKDVDLQGVVVHRDPAEDIARSQSCRAFVKVDMRH